MDGSELIAAERKRQVAEEGWTPEHDSTHTEHELALAAACYAAPDRIYIGHANEYEVRLAEAWPWHSKDDKRSREVRCWYPKPLGLLLKNADTDRRGRKVKEKRIRELAKAGALLAAEIDRIERIASP